LSRGNLDFLSVEQVQHRPEAVSLGAVEAGEGSTVGVENVVVVRGGELDELEHLTLGSEPLKDVGVVVAGSTLGESLAFFHACIIPEVSRVVQRKLEKSCELVQEQDAQTKTDELEHFEDELRFLHAFIISHHCRIASTKKVFLLSCCKCLRNKGLQQFVGKYRVIGTPTGVLRTYR
jgi:hypothetical protein